MTKSEKFMLVTIAVMAIIIANLIVYIVNDHLNQVQYCNAVVNAVVIDDQQCFEAQKMQICVKRLDGNGRKNE